MTEREEELIGLEELDSKEKLNHLESMVKFFPGAIAMFDSEMRYVLANEKWYRDYGLEGRDIIGKSHYEIFPQIKKMPEWLNLHQRALAGETLSSDLDSFEQEDDTTYIKWKLSPWYEADDSIGGIIMITERVSEEVVQAQRLKEHNNVLSTLLNEMEDGFAHARIIHDDKGNPVNWLYLNVGKGLEHYVPVPPETLVGKTVTDAIPGAIEADPKWLHIFNDVATTGKSQEIEEYSVVLDRWFRMNVYSPAKGEFATIFRDITEKVKTQEKLKKLNQLFEEVSQLGKIGTWEIDVKTEQCYWSDVVYQIHEEDPSKEIKVEDGIKYFHPEYQEILQEAVDKAIKERKPYDLELKLITAKGREVWTRAIGQAVFENDEVVKLRGLFQDIDDKRNREIKLEKKNAYIKLLNERFTFAKETAELGVWDWDIKNDVLVWDDQMYDLYGVKRDHFESDYEAWQQGIHPDDRKRSNDEVEKCLAEEKIFDTSFRVVWPSGEIKYLGARGKVIRDEKGKPARMIGLNWDITEEVAREKEIKDLNRNLQKKVDRQTKHLRKSIEELESFSYSISHDLRAPLRAINGYSEAFIEEYSHELKEDAGLYMERIAANSKKMGMLIDDLLEFSRLNRQKVDHKKIDLQNLTEGIINDTFAGTKDIIELKPLPTIIGDPEMISQVFTNVISNAIKYSSKEQSPEVQISYEEEQDTYLIVITDNGAGFNMDYYDKIFKVFERLHSEAEFEGTGVGLSLCDRIMKAHDGEIFAESKEGVGSSFYLRFKK
ncbi:PAS domain-containing protein [Ekhidna sp.]|uniref:PAS domain-containing protein n=1 Tax=Ekhidna sp. TaxID=2608089 RepID=UPI003CCC008B